MACSAACAARRRARGRSAAAAAGPGMGVTGPAAGADVRAPAAGSAAGAGAAVAADASAAAPSAYSRSPKFVTACTERSHEDPVQPGAARVTGIRAPAFFGAGTSCSRGSRRCAAAHGEPAGAPQTRAAARRRDRSGRPGARGATRLPPTLTYTLVLLPGTRRRAPCCLGRGRPPPASGARVAWGRAELTWQTSKTPTGQRQTPTHVGSAVYVIACSRARAGEGPAGGRASQRPCWWCRVTPRYLDWPLRSRAAARPAAPFAVRACLPASHACLGRSMQASTHMRGALGVWGLM